MDTLNVKIVPSGTGWYWILYLPAGNTITCDTIEQAREIASGYGKGIAL